MTVPSVQAPILCRLHYKKICTSVNLTCLSEIFFELKSPSILGGNLSKKEADRFSYWAAEPKEIFEFWEVQKDPFVKLNRILNKYNLKLDARRTPAPSEVEGTHNAKTELPKGMFTGGWIGYFSYELGRYIERLPEITIDDLEMPLIRLCFYDKLIAYDHTEGTFWLIALQLPGDIEGPSEKLASLERLLSDAKKVHIEQPTPPDLDAIDFSHIACNMSKEYYLQAIKNIKHYIYDGDVYQVNFSQRFQCDYNSRAIDLFHWQNQYNPSPYSAYIDGGDFHIVSASPEMFITIADGCIATKPIKGTRPRMKNTDKDLALELLNSEKEQAELNMIIDLERNDVAKICEPGTRRVIQPRTIESYPTVYHAAATVGGKLREDVTFCDVLKAMFPGGSITGAPKIRSMEIIDETEPAARGVYTGSIGFIGLDGSVCLNIAIRTIIIKDQKAYAQTGGGIVADSEPEAEWDETITKAKALIAGIKATQANKHQIYER
jgi:para-aminobenzoate synthetase component 1